MTQHIQSDDNNYSRYVLSKNVAFSMRRRRFVMLCAVLFFLLGGCGVPMEDTREEYSTSSKKLESYEFLKGFDWQAFGCTMTRITSKVPFSEKTCGAHQHFIKFCSKQCKSLKDKNKCRNANKSLCTKDKTFMRSCKSSCADLGYHGLGDIESITNISDAIEKRKHSSGSFRCKLCWKGNCSFAKKDQSISLSIKIYNQRNRLVSFPIRTCGQIEELISRRGVDPSQCSTLQALTLRSQNICGCEDSSGNVCKSSTPKTIGCDLCASSDRIVGDPKRVIPTGVLRGFTCGFISKNPAYVPSSLCSSVQEAFTQHCGCYDKRFDPLPKQCLPQESVTCNPNDATDVCCDNLPCVYRKSFRRYVCSGKGDQR